LPAGGAESNVAAGDQAIASGNLPASRVEGLPAAGGFRLPLPQVSAGLLFVPFVTFVAKVVVVLVPKPGVEPGRAYTH